MSTENRWRRTSCLTAVGIVGALTLAGCGASSAEQAEPNADSLRIVLGSKPQPSQIPLVNGVARYGGDFGLTLNVEQNVMYVDKAQVLATSFSAILDAREQGEDIKVFCPYVSTDDFVLAGANGVYNAGNLFEPSTRVGIDNPGGSGAIVLNALLSGAGEPRDVHEIPNQHILESSSARLDAWIAGEVDATVIHETQYEGAKALVNRLFRKWSAGRGGGYPRFDAVSMC